MPSVIQPGPPNDSPDAAAHLRAEGALEIGFLLRKVLDARAQYAPDHPNARAALGKLHERLFTLVTTAPSLTLDVGSTQLSVGGHPLAKNVTASA